MLKKMNGKKFTNDQMEKLNVRGGLDIQWMATRCNDYCSSRCGTKEGSTEAHNSGQLFYQN